MWWEPEFHGFSPPNKVWYLELCNPDLGFLVIGRPPVANKQGSMTTRWTKTILKKTTFTFNISGFQIWVVHACRPFCRKYFLQILLPEFIQDFLWMNACRTEFICFTSLLQKVYFTPSIQCFLLSEKRSACLSESTLKPTISYKTNFFTCCFLFG